MKPFVELDAANFDREIIEAHGLSLVCFYAARSAASRNLQKELSALAPALSARLKLARLNVRKEQRLAASYHVRSAPALVLFRSGKAVETVSGNLPADALRAKLDFLLEQYAPTDQERVPSAPRGGAVP